MRKNSALRNMNWAFHRSWLQHNTIIYEIRSHGSPNRQAECVEIKNMS